MLSENHSEKGKNILTPPPSTPWYEILLEKFQDPIIKILIAACVVNLIVNIYQHEPLWDTLAILAAILITTLVGFYQDMSAKAQFESLNKVSDEEMIKVRRTDDITNEPKVITIPKPDVCVGDEVLVSAGDEVCADIILTEAIELHCDESCMTGESVPVTKIIYDDEKSTIPSNMICRGTTITEGSGYGTVIAVGDNTKIGQTTRQAREMTDDKTPLTVQLENLADKITVLSYWIAGALLVFLNCHLFFFSDYSFEFGSFITKEIGFIMTAIVIIIAAVPEGLALSVVLALTYSVKAMMKDNNLVKKMKATETVGAVDIIFSDKTGTLTQNKMTVVDSDIMDIEAVCNNSAINSTAELEGDKVIGNPTEGAILKWVNSQNFGSYKHLRDTYNLVSQKPFNSTDKYMMSVANEVEWYKGAPEVIAKLCGNSSFLSKVEEQQAKGRRAISFATKTENRGWKYDGTVFIEDPVRTDVPDAVAKCYKAGVDVVMMTGDNIKTAAQIGKDAGFKNVYAIEAKDFNFNEDPKTYHPNVIARCKPEDKLSILKFYQNAGYICAMTGDGVNDSPSLNHASVGIAMGSGTSVAKEASDIVLLDDAFPSIVKGVKWGRSLYKNIQSFLLFQLTVNVSLCLTACFGPIFGCENPFSVIEILYINLVMDALGALALASEPALDSVLDALPRDKKEFIINKEMIKHIGTFGVVLFCAMMSLIVLDVNSTLLFSIFMTTNLIHLFIARSFGKDLSITSLGRNKLFCLVAILIFLANFIIIQFGGSIFNTTALDLAEWFITIGCSVTILGISWVIKKVIL